MLHVKMEGAPVVGSQVGGKDTLPPPPGTQGLQKTMAGLCEAGSGVGGHKATLLRSTPVK